MQNSKNVARKFEGNLEKVIEVDETTPRGPGNFSTVDKPQQFLTPKGNASSPKGNASSSKRNQRSRSPAKIKTPSEIYKEFLEEAKKIEEDIRASCSAQLDALAEELSTLEKVIVSEIRKINLQGRQAILNELEVQLLNLSDIKENFRIASGLSEEEANAKSAMASSKIQKSRLNLSKEDFSKWSDFYKYYTENKSQVISLTSCQVKFLRKEPGSSSLAKFEKFIREGIFMLKNFEKPKFFLSEILSGFLGENDGLEKSMVVLEKMRGSEVLIIPTKQKSTGNPESKQPIESFRVFDPMRSSSKMGESRINGDSKIVPKAPIIYCYTNDICFFSEAGGTVSSVGLTEGKVLWKSGELDSEVVDICVSTSEEKDYLLVLLENNSLASGRIEKKSNGFKVTMESIAKVGLDYSYPYSVLNVVDLSQGKKVLICASNGSFCIFDFGSGNNLLQMSCSPGIKRLSCVTLAYANELVAFGSGSIKNSNQNCILVFSIKTVIGEFFQFSPYHTFKECYSESGTGVLSITSPNTKDIPYLYSTGLGATSIKIWNIVTKQLVSRVSTKSPVFRLATLLLQQNEMVILGYGETEIFLMKPRNSENQEWRVESFRSTRKKGSLRKSIGLMFSQDKVLLGVSNLLGEIETYLINV